MTENDNKPKRDFRQDLTNLIVDLIERGSAPWQKPWNPDTGILEMPYNATSGRAYRGANALYLMAKAQLLGSDDPRWCTFKQAQAEGWHVKKGSKGTCVEYWQFEKVEERVDPVTGKKEKVKEQLEKPRVFYATVFHASQIEGIPEYKRRDRPVGWNPLEEAERILTASGARIFHDQKDRAYYSPSTDEIHLPPRMAFPQPLDYYEVAMHELGHWTGHEKRLNRDLSGGFGSESYAREELRAQMASLYLSAELGVPFNPDRHAAYQASWVKVLKEDKHEIFRAARDAETIADYVTGLARERTIEKAQERIAENAREQVRERFGKDSKIVDAKFVDIEHGKFTGTIVAQDDDRVIQRIGANKFIAHERSALDGSIVGVGIGQFVKIQYNQGMAVVQSAQRQHQQGRQRGPDREIAR